MLNVTRGAFLGRRDVERRWARLRGAPSSSPWLAVLLAVALIVPACSSPAVSTPTTVVASPTSVPSPVPASPTSAASPSSAAGSTPTAAGGANATTTAAAQATTVANSVNATVTVKIQALATAAMLSAQGSATATAPTSVAASSATPPAAASAAAVVAPSPTNAYGCATEPVRGFGLIFMANSSVATKIGCPSAGEIGVSSNVEVFEKGTMLEFGNAKQIYVLLKNGSTWASYADTYQNGQPLPTATVVPTTGRFAPVGAFGLLWEQNADVRGQLGWAMSPVQSATTGAVQEFAHGWMYWTPDLMIYVLYADKTWQTFPDTFQG